ncbi:hypothetical protein ACOHYD_00210 [Desulfobacterota bacterium M19]
MYSVRRLFLIAFVAIMLAACSSTTYVRHLASDAALIVPRQTTSKEVLNYLGPPDYQLKLANGLEWIYFQGNKSLLRKTPYIGYKFGREDYDLLEIFLKDNVVQSRVYRLFNERQFKQFKKNKLKAVEKK